MREPSHIRESSLLNELVTTHGVGRSKFFRKFNASSLVIPTMTTSHPRIVHPHHHSTQAPVPGQNMLPYSRFLASMQAASFITGAGFKALCDIQDHSAPVKNGQISFSGLLESYGFAKSALATPFTFRIITHNGDGEMNARPELVEPRLEAWFAQNVVQDHPKLIPLPIGIANPQWSHGNVNAIMEVLREPQPPRTVELFLTFQAPSTNAAERNPAFALATSRFNATYRQMELKEFWRHLRRAKYVLAPRGNGPDCHRMWEALYAGAVPIIRRHQSFVEFAKRLPVLVVDSWEEVTPQLLRDKWPAMQAVFERDVTLLDMEYWRKRIRGPAPLVW